MFEIAFVVLSTSSNLVYQGLQFLYVQYDVKWILMYKQVCKSLGNFSDVATSKKIAKMYT